VNIDVTYSVLRFHLGCYSAASRLLAHTNGREVVGKMLVNFEAEHLTDSHSCCPTKDEKHALIWVPARRQERHCFFINCRTMLLFGVNNWQIQLLGVPFPRVQRIAVRIFGRCDN